jgi:hypothetical protein
MVAPVALQGRQILQIAGVGQGIQVDHRFVGLRKPIQDEVAADEPGAAGDEDGHVEKDRVVGIRDSPARRDGATEALSCAGLTH